MVPSALVPLHVPEYFPAGSAAASASAENKSNGMSRRMGANLSKNRGPRGTIILALEEAECLRISGRSDCLLERCSACCCLAARRAHTPTTATKGAREESTRPKRISRGLCAGTANAAGKRKTGGGSSKKRARDAITTAIATTTVTKSSPVYSPGGRMHPLRFAAGIFIAVLFLTMTGYLRS